MPWKEQNKMSLKEEFVRFALQPGANKRELMRRFRISPPTGYKWIARYMLEGKAGLHEHSRRPHRSPAQTSEQMEQEIEAIRKKYEYWGARKLRHILIERGVKGVPGSSTVHRILQRRGLIEPKTVFAAPGIRFERDNPNELWQMDFKGHFALLDGKRCHPFTVCDDCSRYSLSLQGCADEKTRTVQYHLQGCFERYGLPISILCDNGSPWGRCTSDVKATNLELWLMRIGVNICHGRPYHPQTQGKEERFHRTFDRELLKRTTVWKDLSHCQQCFDPWRQQYNTLRPHESLQMRTPAQVYRPSDRTMPQQVPSAMSYYLSDDVIRKVKSKGEITFKNQSFYLGNAFIAEPVALRRVGQSQWQVFYCWKSFGYIDFRKVTKSKNQYESLLAQI